MLKSGHVCTPPEKNKRCDKKLIPKVLTEIALKLTNILKYHS